MSTRVCRCSMFVPTNNPRFTERAWTRGADAYILDLEDSVPMSEKERARSLIRETIPVVAKGGASVYVRVNKPFVEADLRASIWPGVERIVLPKAESGEELRQAADLITELEKERGIPAGYVEISPLIESALGVANIYDIVTSTGRIRSIGGGTGYDMALDLGIEMFAPFDQYAYPDAMPTLAAMAAGIEEPHGGCFVPNPSGTAVGAEQAVVMAVARHAAYIREAGALHPALIQPLVSGLSPTAGEIGWAKKVLDVYEKLEHEGESMTVVDDRGIDRYEYALARDTLEWADACAVKDRFMERALARAQAKEQKEK